MKNRWLVVCGGVAVVFVSGVLVHRNPPARPAVAVGGPPGSPVPAPLPALTVLNPHDFAGPQGRNPGATRSTDRLADPAGALARAAAARQAALAGGRDPEAARREAATQLLARFAALHARTPAAAPRTVLRGPPRGYGHTVFDARQQAAVDRLLATLGAGADLQMDATAGTVRHVSGPLARVVAGSAGFQAARRADDAAGMARATLQELAEVLNVREPAERFVARSVAVDALGMTHVRLQETCGGLPVYGAELYVHLDRRNDPVQVSGVYAAAPALPGLLSRIAPEEAIAKAAASLGVAPAGVLPPTVTRLVYWNPERLPIEAYQVELFPALTAAYRVFVAAGDGTWLHAQSLVTTAGPAVGSGTDLWGSNRVVQCWQNNDGSYVAVDTTCPIYDNTSTPPNLASTRGALTILNAGGRYFVDAYQNNQLAFVSTANRNSWDAAAVSVMQNLKAVEAYYRTAHGRQSIDGSRMSIVSAVHATFTADGNPDNACWHPGMKMLFFGDGRDTFTEKLPTLDIAGHELTHGVISFTADLAYENQSGALNEHLADYFGCMVDRDDWLIWDGAMKKPGQIAGRDLANPKNPAVESNYQPENMSQYYNLANDGAHDWGGVHVNCSIPSRAAYLFTDPAAQGMGRDKAERIVYRALAQYLTKYAQFIDYRRALLSAAKDLYGDGGAEMTAIRNAFDAVELPDGGGGGGSSTAPTNTPGPVTAGDEFVLFLGPYYSWGIYVGDALYQMDKNAAYSQISHRLVSQARPAISGGGQWGLYVGDDNNVYWTTGATEEQWTTTANVRSIALSKDARYIAVATTDLDNSITVIDTVSQTDRKATLTVPSDSGGVSPLSYAAVMSFNFAGDALMYDAVCQTKVNGQDYAYWAVYGLRIKDLASSPLMPAPYGLQVGNPSCAHTRALSFVGDYIFTDNEGRETIGVVSVDLENNTASVLTNGLAVVAQPTFRGDDRKLVFRELASGVHYFYEATLANNGTALTAATPIFYSATDPLSFPIGFRAGTYTQATGHLAVTPATLAFGTVSVAQTVTNTLTFTNSGSADLDLLGVTVEAADTNVVNSFGFGGAVQTRIPAGGAQRVPITFRPKLTGALAATLRVKTSVPTQGDVLVNLSGTGQAARMLTAEWRQAWEDFNRRYSYFALKGIDWNGVWAAHSNDCAAVSDPAVFAVKLNDMLQVLRDWHVWVRKPDGAYLGYDGSCTVNYNPAKLTYTRYVQGGGAYQDVNNAHVIYHAWLQTNIAHIIVTTLDGGAFGAISDGDIGNLFVTYAGAAGLILDLRANSGGDEANARKFAERLAERTYTFGYVRNRIPGTDHNAFEDYFPKTLSPSPRMHFTNTVVCLVGQKVMSSGEAFALMLRACPRVTLIGDRTRGASANTMATNLPSINVSYSISQWVAYDAQKRTYEDVGLAPDLAVPPGAGAGKSYDDNQDYVLERAIQWVRLSHADSNANRTPDAWEQLHFRNLTSVTRFTDFDRDGSLDVDEYWAGTCPTNPRSRLGFDVDVLLLPANAGAVLRWPSVAHRQYTLRCYTNLTRDAGRTWPDLPATPPLNVYTDTTAVGRGPYFYRVSVPKR